MQGERGTELVALQQQLPSVLKPRWRNRFGGFVNAFVVAALVGLQGSVGYACALAALAVVQSEYHRKFFIAFDANGAREFRRFGMVRELPWSDITHYTLTPGYKDESIVLHGRGTRIVVSKQHEEGAAVIDALLRIAHSMLAGTTRFGPFAITDAGLAHDKAGLLRWADLETVRVRGGNSKRVEVMKLDKAFPWATLKVTELPNVLLFFEALHERGIAIEIDKLWRLTPRLLEAQQLQQALPRAEVRRLPPG